MIRFVHSGITDQLGRSNFVDSNGFCIGFKEFPDGTPILWTTHPYTPYYEREDDEVTYPMLSSFQSEKSLHEFLDGANCTFGYAGVHTLPEDGKTQVARIVMLKDDYEGEEHRDAFYLYVIVSKGDDVYFADFSMSMEDRVKLFGNADTIAKMLQNIRKSVGNITKQLNSLDLVINAMRKSNLNKEE